MHLKGVLTGPQFTVLALDCGTEAAEDCPSLTFIECLNPQEQDTTMRLLALHAEKGPITNEQRSRKVSSKLFEFKPGRHRLMYFYLSGRRTVLTHGFSKGDPLPPEIRRADRLRAAYLETTGDV